MKVKAPKDILPFACVSSLLLTYTILIFLIQSPPLPFGKTTTTSNFIGMDPPTPLCFAYASNQRFLSPGLVHLIDPLQQQLATKERARSKFPFFFTPYSTGPTGRCLEFHMQPVHSVLPRIDLTPPQPPHAPSCHSPYAFQPAPLDLRLGSSKKESPSVFFRSPPWSNTIRGHFALLATPPIQPIISTSRMERIRFSACFCTLSSSLRSVYIITTQFFFVLRSSFCSFLGNLP